MLPAETMLAVFPRPVRVGGMLLNPPTAYHAAAMEHFGVPFGSPCGPGNVFVAAWVLSMSAQDVKRAVAEDGFAKAELERFIEEAASLSVSELVRCVDNAVALGLAPHVKCETEGKTTLSPSGFGWPLEVGEAVAHEYAMSFDEAMAMPLCTAFGMLACANKRNSGKASGPDYYDRIFTKAAKAMKAAKGGDGNGGK